MAGPEIAAIFPTANLKKIIAISKYENTQILILSYGSNLWAARTTSFQFKPNC